MQHKLVSDKGTLLGTITIPDSWSDRIRKGHAASAAFLQRIPFARIPADVVYAPMLDVRHVTLVADWGEYPDALRLVQGSIEDLEKMSDCSFSPSMAYLRSQIEAAQI